MRTIRSPRLGSLLLPGAFLLAATLAAPLASPAHATEASPGGFRIDEDYIRVSAADSTAQVIAPRALAFLRNNRVQVQVHGGVHRATAAPGCRSAKVTFVFADETRETTRESARACKQYGVTYKDVDFHPTKEKDVVRYYVSLLTSTDISAPSTTITYGTFLVGDSPDSLGTAARLDHDAVELVHQGQRIFTEGSSDWRIQREEIAGATLRFARNRVTGTLTRPTWLAGERAWLRAVWTYADGKTSTKLSGAVTSSAPTTGVNLASDKYKEVVSVEIKVISDWPASTTPLITRFGDYYGR